tara:strand:- start:1185 stop:1394 length:210 start_codon:yes stop_codon:yes gene_type:complete
MPTEKSARLIIMERLNSEIIKAQTSDLQRAADFLEGARKVRAGSKKQRRLSREAHKEAYYRKVDNPLSW